MQRHKGDSERSFGDRPYCGLWPSERCALFITGVKVTSNWKERLIQQLLDGDLQEYLMQKEQWTTHSFYNIRGKRNETALKRKSKARQAKQRRCVTTYGTLALITNNGIVTQKGAVCAAIIKIGGMSSHKNHLMPH
jgi:hypothetical protein